MQTIYWIQRLGAINSALTFIAVLLAMMIFVLVIMAITYYKLGEVWGEDDPDYKRYKKCKKTIPKVAIVFFVSALGSIFVPSERDLYIIYGVGGTIDYIKSSDTAKQLPDKVINALDAWVDSNTHNNDKDK